MKTYSEILETTTINFPAEIDEGTQGSIYDWFQYREVCDDNKFKVFFERLLKQKAARYAQLLRIEPGISNYDWLVTRYTEAQRVITGTDNTDGTIRRTGTDDLMLTTTGGRTRTTEHLGGDTRKTEYGHIIKDAGQEGLTNHTITDKGTIKDEGTDSKDGTITTTKTALGSTIKTTSDTRELIDSLVEEYDGDTVNINTGFVSEDHKRLEKNLPMSTSYTPGTVFDPTPDTTADDGGINASGQALEWSSASAQGQSYGADIDHHKSTTSYPDKRDTRRTKYEDGGLLTESTTHSQDYKDVNTQEIDTEGTKGNTRTLDTTRTEAYSKTNGNTQTHEGNDTLKSEYNSRFIESFDGTEYGHRDRDVDLTTGQKVLRETQNKDRYRHTGRDGEIADILARAKSYIIGTSAFEWLQKELEICFIGVYDR